MAAVRPGRRSATYWLANAAFLVLVLLGTAVTDDPDPRFFYLILLFALCSSPILIADTPNGRYVILTVMGPLLFLYYGMTDLLHLVPGWSASRVGMATGLLTTAEFAILLAVALFILGYRAAMAAWRGKPSRIAARDWRHTHLVAFGLVFWAVGLAGTWIWSSQLVERYSTVTYDAATTMVLLVARLVQPVGIGLLAYAFITSRKTSLTILIVAILLIEFVFGFVADSKELAIRSLAIVIVGKYLLEGRVPKKWLVISGVGIILSFSVFYAYRLEVLQLGRQTRAAAAENLSANVDKALQSSLRGDSLLRGGIMSFTGRLNLKPTMQMVTMRVGDDVQYQGGATLVHLFTAFIPRVIWPDKPDSSVGKLMNKEFQVSASSDTYISATHPAELYWNFGWPGLIVGMFVIGFFLGFVNSRFALAEGRSLTRFLVLVTTIYLLCLRFEGSIALEYIVWIRSLALIALLHLVFAKVQPRLRRPAARPAQGDGGRDTGEDEASPGKGGPSHTAPALR